MSTQEKRVSPLRLVLLVITLTVVGVGAWWVSRDSAAQEATDTPTPTASESIEVEMPAPAPGATGDAQDSGDGDASSSADPEEESEEDDAPEDAPAKPKSADDAVLAAVQDYLTARENAVSYYHKTDRDWLKKIKPTMTSSGYAELSKAVGDGTGGAGQSWQEAHERGLAVKVYVECQEEANGVNDKSTRTVLCSLNDQVVDKDGKPVAVSEVPAVWPYVGPQESVTLEVRRGGDGWRVHQDYTGLAG